LILALSNKGYEEKIVTYKLIQKIKIAEKQFHGDDDDIKRMVKLELTGKNSLTAMNATEKQSVLDHYKSLGFVVETKAKKKLTGQTAKLFSIWQQMADSKFIRDRSYKSLEKWAIENCKGDNNGTPINKLEWFTSSMLHSAVEQLKGWQKREQDKADANKKAMSV
jgi:phage gp16-like protein